MVDDKWELFLFISYWACPVEEFAMLADRVLWLFCLILLAATYAMFVRVLTHNQAIPAAR